MSLSHPAGTLVEEPSEPGAASTAPALAHTCFGGASVSDRTCSIEGCAKAHYARDMCSTHYKRWKAHGDPGIGPTGTPYGAPLAFIQQAVASATDRCIVWPYARTGKGYGKLYVGGKLHGAHRLALELAAGPPPARGMTAAHAPSICHNRLCVNPRHLRWATQAENHADKVEDGTHNRGERQHASKLTTADVLAIYVDRRRGRGVQMAAEYGVTPAAISGIRRGRTWSWLTDRLEVVRA